MVKTKVSSGNAVRPVPIQKDKGGVYQFLTGILNYLVLSKPGNWQEAGGCKDWRTLLFIVVNIENENVGLIPCPLSIGEGERE